MTLEGDEVYTRVGENLSPCDSEGWTIHFLERESCYGVEARASLQDSELFELGDKAAWDWAEPSEFIRWLADGERRYGNELWKSVSIDLPAIATPGSVSRLQGVVRRIGSGDENQRLSRKSPD